MLFAPTLCHELYSHCTLLALAAEFFIAGLWRSHCMSASHECLPSAETLATTRPPDSGQMTFLPVCTVEHETGPLCVESLRPIGTACPCVPLLCQLPTPQCQLLWLASSLQLGMVSLRAGRSGQLAYTRLMCVGAVAFGSSCVCTWSLLNVLCLVGMSCVSLVTNRDLSYCLW